MVIVNYFMLSAAVLSGLAKILFWRNPAPSEWLMLIMIGTFGYIGQTFMTKAFQSEPANRMAQIQYMKLVYSLIIGLLWFGENYSLLSFIGILLILTSMFLNVVIKTNKKVTPST